MYLVATCIKRIRGKSNHIGALKHEQQMHTSTDTDVTTLMTIAKHGLPKTKQPKHVIIIGAGIAGLTAAKLLKDAGHKVTILEASNRVGGRILTYRDPDNRYYVDLGAMRIPKTHEFVKTFVDHFNLSTSDYVSYDRNTWCYLNGKKVKTGEMDEDPDILGFNTSSKEKGKSSDELVLEAAKEVFDKCCKNDVFNNMSLAQYDKYSFKEFLNDVAGLSEEAVSMIGVTTNTESTFYTAFTEIIRDWNEGEYYEIVGGTDLLPRAFLPSLEENILYNARVTSVEHGNGAVVAHYLSSGTDVAISGDYLLTTATATATSFIKFIPVLDKSKREAIRNIHYLCVTKIWLIFQRPFWKDEGITGGESITDLPSRSILYPCHDFESGLGVVLASYTYGDQSTIFLGLSDDECLTQALNDLAEIHGDHIRDMYLEGLVKKWTLDPYSLGGYAFLTPYQLIEMRSPLVRPTGNLFFAGEHTNFPHGWMDTAIKSAVEAVHFINTK